MDSNFLFQLQKRLADGPLPGRDAQFRMAHLSRRIFESANFQVPENPKIAAVVCLFFLKNGAWHLLLIERTSSNPNDRHSGQISFPGGKMDETDASLEAAALRELEEEIGISPQNALILGRLTELFIPVSGFLVHPFVAVLNENPAEKTGWQPQPSEVETILEVPLAWLQSPASRQTKDLVVGNGMTWKDVPFFEVEGRTVWGATAMILSELLELIG